MQIWWKYPRRYLNNISILYNIRFNIFAHIYLEVGCKNDKNQTFLYQDLITINSHSYDEAENIINDTTIINTNSLNDSLTIKLILNKAEGNKCARCWRYCNSVDNIQEICDRCNLIVSNK